jgi:hypothetical protein
MSDDPYGTCWECGMKRDIIIQRGNKITELQAELKLAQSFSHWESVTVDKLRAELLIATQAVFVTARERQEFKAELNRIRPAAQAVVDDAYHFEDEHSDDELVALVDSEIIGNLAAALE